jgi:DNA-binding beta-propeller fold protein YncE
MTYEVVPAWERLPPEHHHSDVAGVDVGADDRVYLLTRNENRVFVYDRDGTFQTTWGDGIFTTPHGLTVAPDGTVYCVDCGDHTVRRFSQDGTLLQTIGTPGVATDTGYRRGGGKPVVHNVETVARPAGPFNGCTNLTVAPTGDLYVADGYGNCRVHRFTADGELITSWGGIGTGPGEFHLPHGIRATADGRILVADRENERIQIFDLDGTYMTSWTDIQRPADLAVDRDGLVYVAELWRPRGTASFTHGTTPVDLPGRVTVLDPAGNVVARWGSARGEPGHFIAPHAIAVDAAGDVYVGEVTGTFGVAAGRVPGARGHHQLQKFVRT